MQWLKGGCHFNKESRSRSGSRSRVALVLAGPDADLSAEVTDDLCKRAGVHCPLAAEVVLG